jgi:hypothetical protein
LLAIGTLIVIAPVAFAEVRRSTVAAFGQRLRKSFAVARADRDAQDRLTRNDHDERTEVVFAKPA